MSSQVDCSPAWRISVGLNPEIQTWPDGGIVFCRASGDTHWVPESACLVLAALHPSPLSQSQLQQKLANWLEMPEDEPVLSQIVDAACAALIKAALIEPHSG